MCCLRVDSMVSWEKGIRNNQFVSHFEAQSSKMSSKNVHCNYLQIDIFHVSLMTPHLKDAAYCTWLDRNRFCFLSSNRALFSALVLYYSTLKLVEIPSDWSRQTIGSIRNAGCLYISSLIRFCENFEPKTKTSINFAMVVVSRRLKHNIVAIVNFMPGQEKAL